jgi:hypothetical protein
MSYHPAYPTTADLLRETDAEERDVADLVALRDLRCDSAWKKDPLGGVIGVQKGPL